ncbi:TauD/TfdA family dioxygenase [Nocardia sp. NPDC056064]|uniref:TauD/TfdA family dioxygenase n=1 Tax=Nocardia sp. NPDC056064 TaxID=3345701 RepID=UPI0035DE58A1
MSVALHMEEIALRARCLSAETREIRNRLDDCGFAIIEPNGPAELVLDDIMLPLGEPVEYGFGTKLALEPRAGEQNLQFTERGMPLHTDGAFNPGPEVKYIGMQCVTAPAAGGESLVASSVAFFEHAPADLLETMRTISIEYRNRIAGYYRGGSEDNHPKVPPIRLDPVTGAERLIIGLTDPEDPMRTHDAVVMGYEPDRSAELMRRISEALHMSSVLYAHKWRPGEVMVLDNRRVVHGRAPFPNQQRKIVRLSVS